MRRLKSIRLCRSELGKVDVGAQPAACKNGRWRATTTLRWSGLVQASRDLVSRAVREFAALVAKVRQLSIQPKTAAATESSKLAMALAVLAEHQDWTVAKLSCLGSN